MLFVDVVRGMVRVLLLFCLCLFMRGEEEEEAASSTAASACSGSSDASNRQIQNCVDFGLVLMSRL